MRPTLFAVLIAAALPAQAADLKALQCGNVFDSKSAKLIGAQTIVIEKNTIKSLSPGKIAIEGAQTVDLSQLTCMPGFIDMHVHLGQQSNPQSYSEGFRLDDIDFAFRAVGTPIKRCRPALLQFAIWVATSACIYAMPSIRAISRGRVFMRPENPLRPPEATQTPPMV